MKLFIIILLIFPFFFNGAYAEIFQREKFPTGPRFAVKPCPTKAIDDRGENCKNHKIACDACAIAAIITAPFTFGLSGVACVVPCLLTEQACKARDWSLQHYAKCLTDNTEAEMGNLESEKLQREWIEQLNGEIARHELEMETLNQLPQAVMQDVRQHIISEGYSLDSDDAQDFMRKKLIEVNILVFQKRTAEMRAFNNFYVRWRTYIYGFGMEQSWMPFIEKCEGLVTFHPGGRYEKAPCYEDKCVGPTGLIDSPNPINKKKVPKCSAGAAGYDLY